MPTQQTQQEIIKEFKGSGDWLDKYSRLIKIGKALPDLEEKYKTDETLVNGCQMKTWFSYTFKDGKIYYRVDSMSLIIRGALVLLLKVLDGRTPEEIKNTDLYFIDQTGLRELFAPVRANSLWKVVNQMQAAAKIKE